MAKRGRKGKSILKTGDINHAVDSLHKVKPTDRKVIHDYLTTNGSIQAIARNNNLTRKQVYNILRKPANRSALRRAFRKIGIDLPTTVRVVKFVMLRKGDFHYDFNRLKAVELWAKLTGAFAPKRIKFEGGVDIRKRTEVQKVVRKLVHVLKADKNENLIEGRSRL